MRGKFKNTTGVDGVSRMWYTIDNTMLGCIMWDKNIKAWVASCLLVESKFNRKKYHEKNTATDALITECDKVFISYVPPIPPEQLCLM